MSDDLKKTNFCFHYSEKLKSNFFLVAGIIDKLAALEGEKWEGGREVVRSVLAALRRELNLGKKQLPAEEVNFIENKVMEALGEIELRNYIKAREKLAEALSRVTTLSDRYMEILKQAGWI